MVVDDDAVFCDIAREVLEASGFQVRCAEDGFEGLALLWSEIPHAIICDLNMPRMSGFEFLSLVRRRFPQIAVIAISGEFSGPAVPEGVLADLFFEKGSQSPQIMVEKLRELLAKSSQLPKGGPAAHAPVWVPRQQKDYFIVTCTGCLRSFAVPASDKPLLGKKEQITKCESCGTELRYILDTAILNTPKMARVSRVK